MESLYDLGNAIIEQLVTGKKLKELDYLVKSYIGTDYLLISEFSDNKYTRNIGYSNNIMEIVVICWNNNQESGVHDHPEYGCIMKVLEGELEEDIYREKEFVCTNKLIKDNIGYQEGKTGLHNIRNGNHKTISLHVYCPPKYKPTLYHSC